MDPSNNVPQRRKAGIRTLRHPSGWWTAWAAVVIGTLVLVGLATLPPFVEPKLRAVLMVGFSGACHQIAERSPDVAGIPFAVCHRCYGIYWGLPLAAAAYALMWRYEGFLDRAAPVIVPLSLLPLSIDWLVDVLGWWSNTYVSRFMTGSVFGIVGGLYLAKGVVGLSKRNEKPVAEEPVEQGVAQ